MTTLETHEPDAEESGFVPAGDANRGLRSRDHRQVFCAVCCDARPGQSIPNVIVSLVQSGKYMVSSMVPQEQSPARHSTHEDVRFSQDR